MVARRTAARRAVAVAGAVGEVLGRAFGAAARARRDKPLHPRGSVTEARLLRYGADRPWGVPLLDTAGESRCLVRVSRAMGLPPPLPDIQGVALRVEEDGEPVDLLFATTGTGRLNRYVLLLRRSPRAPMTTLIPLRTPRGPLQLRLSPGPAGQWLLGAAAPASQQWETVGRVDAPPDPGDDRPIRFDPIRHLPAGAIHYPWVRAVRDPAYVHARRRAAAQGTR